MTKTMSIRMDRENFEFLSELTKEQRSDLSKAVRDMVTRGRILFAVEQYKNGEASLGKAAELWTEAADAGNIDAINKLGPYYGRGGDIEKDSALPRTWWQRKKNWIRSSARGRKTK